MTTIAAPDVPTSASTAATSSGPSAPVQVVAVLVLDGTSTDPGRLDAALDGLVSQGRPPERIVVVPLAGTTPEDVQRCSEQLARSTTPVDVLAPGPAGEDAVAAFDRVTTAPVVGGPGGASGTAYGAALAAVTTPAQGAPTEAWFWLLTPACAPAPGALEALLGAARTSRTAGIVGPKLLDWDDPRRLVEMGQQVTRAGRRIDHPSHGEPDQGQYDERTDVLAVALAGVLVRTDVLTSLGGLDRRIGALGAGLDLGWRAQLAGHRVVVAPAARVRLALPGGVVHPVVEADRRRAADVAAEAADDGTDDAAALALDPDADRDELSTSTPRWLIARRGASRRAARRVALTQCSWWALPFLAVWVAVSSVLSALALLLVKRPRHAWVELGDLGALLHPVSGVRSRWRGRRRRHVRRSDLAPVFVSTSDSLAHTWDAVQDAVTLDRVRRSRPVVDAEAAETGPVSEEAEDLTVLPASVPQRIATHPGTLAVLLSAVVAGVSLRSAVGGGLLDARGAGLAGGELLPVTTTSSGLWHLWRDDWHGAGLGTSVETSPAAGVLAGLTWLAERLPYVAEGRSPAAVTLAWLLLAVMPLSALTAYLAGRVVTRKQWLRGLLALAWGISPVLTTAVDAGRVTAALAHVLLPLVVAGFAAAAMRRGSWTSVFATALATALVGALVPLYLAVATLAALGLALGVGHPRARLKGLLLAVLPVALLGPWVLQVVDDPRVLLSGAGLLDRGVPLADPWLVALGFPQGGVGLVQALLLAPLVLAALAGLVRPPRPGRTAALVALSALALVGLAAALAAPRLVLGAALDDGGTPVAVTPWSGVGTDLYAVSLLALVLTAWRVVPTPRGRRDVRAIVAVAATVVVTAGVVGVGGLAARAGAPDLADAEASVPAVALEQAGSVDATRLLVITSTPAGSGSGATAPGVSYSLVGNEPGVPQRDLVPTTRAAGTGGPGSAVTARVVADPGFADVVGGLASGTIDDVTGPGVGSLLADLGVGFVSVRSDPSGSLARTLDAAPGLARLGDTDGQTLWRVLPRTPAQGAGQADAASALPVEPSRVRLTTAQGAPLASVPVTGPHAAVDTVVPDGASGRRLVVAESPQWASSAQVRLDDRVLTPVAGADLPTYELPPGGGRLVIDLPPTHPRWFVAQIVLLLVVVFLAVPFGTRRSRSLT